MATTHKIAEIKGLDTGVQTKLEAANIKTVEDLLKETATPQQRTALAKQLGVGGSQLTEWINRADLMRLKGVGTEMANLLEECGVDSCKELQHRKADNLQAKLKETNDAKHITHHAPTQVQVQEWITEAATFAAQ
jgi:predicted flap endonuclease-1-like 5' DNA nuclease